MYKYKLHLGIQIRAVITMASNPDGMCGESDECDEMEREETITMIARHMKSALEMHETNALRSNSHLFAWLTRFVLPFTIIYRVVYFIRIFTKLPKSVVYVSTIECLYYLCPT